MPPLMQEPVDHCRDEEWSRSTASELSVLLLPDVALAIRFPFTFKPDMMDDVAYPESKRYQ